MIDHRWTLWLMLGEAILLIVFGLVGMKPTALAMAVLLVIPILIIADLFYRIVSMPDDDEE